MSKLIGIGGRLAAGKDVVADYLVDTHGWVKLGMSDPLLEVALVLDPIIYSRDTGFNGIRSVRLSQIVKNHGYVRAKEHEEVRRFLQVLGTDVGRNMISQDLWINKARTTIQQELTAGNDVVITGIRFQDELEMIKHLGRTYCDATALWVERPEQEETPHSNHASEQLTSEGFDQTLVNDSTIQALHQKIDEEVL